MVTEGWLQGVQEHVERKERQKRLRAELAECRRIGKEIRHRKRQENAMRATTDEARSIVDNITAMTDEIRTLGIVRCNVLGKHRVQCTAEALDPNGEIAICSRHAAMVIRLVRERAGV